MTLSPDRAKPLLEHARLVGERVVLRPQTVDDVEDVYALVHGNEAITRWLVWDGPESLEELVEVFASWCVPGADACDYYFAVSTRPDAPEGTALAGSIGVRFAGHPGAGDIGYWVGSPFQGRGYGTEAVRLVTWLAFTHLGAASVFASVFVGNVASRRILERNGFVLTRTGPGHVLSSGERVEEWTLTLLRSDWEGAGRPGPLDSEVRKAT